MYCCLQKVEYNWIPSNILLNAFLVALRISLLNTDSSSDSPALCRANTHGLLLVKLLTACSGLIYLKTRYSICMLAQQTLLRREAATLAVACIYDYSLLIMLKIVHCNLLILCWPLGNRSSLRVISTLSLICMLVSSWSVKSNANKLE